MARLTRAESQDRTRDALLVAAERVFIENGFHATSVEQVAEAAGFSKGAVYSNFGGKDELFLGVLERRFDSRALQVEGRVDPNRPITEQAVDAGDQFIAGLLADPSWSLLLMEYATHVARHPDLRGRFAERNRHIRAQIAGFIDQHLAALSLTSPVATTQLATIFFALGSGIILETLTDPDGVPAEAFGTALGLMFDGIVHANEQAAPGAVATARDPRAGTGAPTPPATASSPAAPSDPAM